MKKGKGYIKSVQNWTMLKVKPNNQEIFLPSEKYFSQILNLFDYYFDCKA